MLVFCGDVHIKASETRGERPREAITEASTRPKVVHLVINITLFAATWDESISVSPDKTSWKVPQEKKCGK